MSPKRAYYMMIGLVVLLSTAVIGSLIGGNIFLENQAKKLNSLKVEDKVLEEQQNALNKDIVKYAELEKDAKSVVPQDKDQAKAVLEIIQIAKASNISIKSITFPSSNLGAKAAPTTNSSDSSEKSGSSSTPVTPPISQAKPVDGIKGVYSLEMNIVPESDNGNVISYYQFLDFLQRLENNRRTAQVTQIRISPKTSDKQSPIITFTLTLNIFVKP